KTIHDVVRIKESGLEKLLTYDWYRRACLLDHFLSDDATSDDFARCAFDELGDFVIEPYRVETRGDATVLDVTMSRDGCVRSGREVAPVTVEKKLTFTAADPGFGAAYRVTNNGDRSRSFRFGVELNLNLLGGGGNPAAYRRFGPSGPKERFDAPAQSDHV